MGMPFNNTSIDDSLNFQTERIKPTVTERCVPPRLSRTGTICGTWTSQYGANGQMTMTLHNYGCRPLYRSSMAKIRTAVREICVPAHRQFHMDLIDKRQWRCRTAGLDDSLGILTENLSSGFGEIPFVPCANSYVSNGQTITALHKYRCRQFFRTSNGKLRSALWEMCVLAHWQHHMGQLGEYSWRCTTESLRKSRERRKSVHWF